MFWKKNRCKIEEMKFGGIVERKHRKARELFIFRRRVHLLREKKPCPVVFWFRRGLKRVLLLPTRYVSLEGNKEKE